MILPVKAGASRTIEHPGLEVQASRWTPDGKKLLLFANEVDGGLRLFVHHLDDSPPRPITPEGCAPGFLPISVDGKYVVVQGPDQVFSMYADRRR